MDKGGGTGYEICTVSANCQAASAGGLGGEFHGADGIGIDATDHVYVADYGSNRIQKFDSNGNFERAWGKDVIQSGKPGDTGTGFEVCTVAADCQAGSSLADGGHRLGGTLYNPFGSLGIDTDGNVYARWSPRSRPISGNTGRSRRSDRHVSYPGWATGF